MKLRNRVTVGIVSAMILTAGAVGYFVHQMGSETNQPADQPLAAPTYRWPKPGETLAYRVSITTRGAADVTRLESEALRKAAQAGSQSAFRQVDSELQLSLALRFVPTTDGAFLVHAKASRTTYRVNDSDAYLPAHFDRPFLFRVALDGRLSDFEFTRGIKPSAEAALRSAIETLQAVLVSEPMRSMGQLRWASVESEMRGDAIWESIVELTPAAPSSTKIQRARRSLTPSDAEVRTTVSASVKSSSLAVTISADRPWIDSVQGDESIVYSSSGRELGVSHTKIAVIRDAIRAEAEPPIDTAAVRAALAAPELRIAALSETDPRLDAQTKSLTLEEMRDWFIENYATNPGLASDTLLNWLRQDPSRAGPLTDWIATNGASMDTVIADQVWWALVASGSNHAMEAFARLLRDPSASDYALLKIVGHAHGFPNPQRPLADALWHLWHARDRSEGLRRTASQSALLALGSLGSADKLNPELGRAIATELSDELHRATTATDKERFLEAIGNHGGVALLPAIERQLVDSDPNIRARAFEAMRGMSASETDEVIFANLEREQSASVRAAAYDAMRANPNRTRIDRAADRIRFEEETVALLALVRVLGAGLTDPTTEPTARQALRELLARRPNMSVRNEIYKFIEP